MFCRVSIHKQGGGQVRAGTGRAVLVQGQERWHLQRPERLQQILSLLEWLRLSHEMSEGNAMEPRAPLMRIRLPPDVPVQTDVVRRRSDVIPVRHPESGWVRSGSGTRKTGEKDKGDGRVLSLFLKSRMAEKAGCGF